MIGFHTYFYWVDEAGEQQRLSGWDAGLDRLMGPVEAVSGDGYPFRYELTAAQLIEAYEHAPVDAAARITELQAVPPGALIHAEEWDQS